MRWNLIEAMTFFIERQCSGMPSNTLEYYFNVPTAATEGVARVPAWRVKEIR